MDYRTEKFPLNHFVLWSKGWYHKVHRLEDVNKDLEQTMRVIFTLDGFSGRYMDSRDFAQILLNRFEDYNYWLKNTKGHYWRIVDLLKNIRDYQKLGYNEDNAIIIAMRSYLQCRPMTEIKLEKPIYSRELYKKYNLIKGHIFSTPKHGMTYKEMNREVSKYKW